MTKVEKLEREIKELSEAEYAELRRWFYERDEEIWDREIEEDDAAGCLDALFDQAVRDDEAGKSRPL